MSKFKFFFIGFIILAVFVLVIRVFFITRVYSDGSGKLVEIRIPSYNGNYDSYFSNSYNESNGCVKFKDGFGIEHSVCGNYQILKY
jgi:hypothetical protein